LAFTEHFIKRFRLNNVIPPVAIKKIIPMRNPQLRNNAFGKAKAPAPNAHDIKAKMLPLNDPGFKGPHVLCKNVPFKKN